MVGNTRDLLIPEKREWLAAVNWLAHYGKKLDAYETLTDEAFRSLLTTFKIEADDRRPAGAHRQSGSFGSNSHGAARRRRGTCAERGFILH